MNKLTMATIAVLGVALWAHHHALGQFQDSNQYLQEVEKRRQVRNGLMAATIDADGITRVQGDGSLLATGPAESVVWVVDPSRCGRCFYDLTSWTALSEDRSVHASLVLTHTSPEEGSRIASEAGLRGRVFVQPGQGILGGAAVSRRSGDRRRVGSVVLTVRPDGRVSTAEVRGGFQGCGWDDLRRAHALVTDRTLAAVRKLPSS